MCGRSSDWLRSIAMVSLSLWLYCCTGRRPCQARCRPAAGSMTVWAGCHWQPRSNSPAYQGACPEDVEGELEGVAFSSSDGWPTHSRQRMDGVSIMPSEPRGFLFRPSPGLVTRLSRIIHPETFVDLDNSMPFSIRRRWRPGVPSAGPPWLAGRPGTPRCDAARVSAEAVDGHH